MKSLDKKKFEALLCEDYYEVIKELIVGLLSIQGYKSYSHYCLISFIQKFYSQRFSAHEIELMDKLRKIRNELDYLGRFSGKGFIERNEKEVIEIVMRLKGIVEEKIR